MLDLSKTSVDVQICGYNFASDEFTAIVDVQHPEIEPILSFNVACKFTNIAVTISLESDSNATEREHRKLPFVNDLEFLGFLIPHISDAMLKHLDNC